MEIHKIGLLNGEVKEVRTNRKALENIGKINPYAIGLGLGTHPIDLNGGGFRELLAYITSQDVDCTIKDKSPYFKKNT